VRCTVSGPAHMPATGASMLPINLPVVVSSEVAIEMSQVAPAHDQEVPEALINPDGARQPGAT